MNRITLITIGIIVLLLISLVWVYLLFFGTPQSTTEVFTNLGFTSTARPVVITPQASTTPNIATSTGMRGTQILKQLTTRHVAGFTFITTATTSSSTGSEAVRYVEQGTGHVYQIDLASGAETLISNTTIPQVSEAVFSPAGTAVVLTTYVGYDRKVFAGSITSSQLLTGTDLPANAENVAFKSNTVVLYTVTQNGLTTGYAQDLTTDTRTAQFSIAFANIDMIWGSGHADTYLITRPDADYQGFIYQVVNGKLLPVTAPVNGLTALASDKQMIVSYIQNSNYVSAAFDPVTASTTALPVLTLPGKCALPTTDPTTVWCAAPLGTIPSTYLTDWYQGTLQSTDYIWKVSVPAGQAALYADPEKLANTTLDADGVRLDQNTTHLAIRNKTDHTLWLVTLPS